MATTSKYTIQVDTKGASQASQKLGGVSNSLSSMAKKAALAGAAYFSAQGIISGMKRAVELAGEQEQAEKQLEKALGKNISSLKAYASAQQQVTTFGDEVTLRAAAQFAQFTKNESQIKQLLTVTQDYAAAQGVDLVSAAQLVAKSFGSSTNALSRYGVEVTGAAGSTERLTSMTENMSRMFGGQAAAAADTMAGRIEQMNNAIGDAYEEIGKALAPIIIDLAEDVKEFAVVFADSIKILNGETGSFSDEAKELAENLETLGDTAKAAFGVMIAGQTINGVASLATSFTALKTAVAGLNVGALAKFGAYALPAAAVGLAISATNDAFNEHYEIAEKVKGQIMSAEEAAALKASRDEARAEEQYQRMQEYHAQLAEEAAALKLVEDAEKEKAAAAWAALMEKKRIAALSIEAWKAEQDGYQAHRDFMVKQYEALGKTEYEKRAEWYLKIAQLDDDEVKRRQRIAKAKQEEETKAIFDSMTAQNDWLAQKAVALMAAEEEQAWIDELVEKNYAFAEAIGVVEMSTKAKAEASKKASLQMAQSDSAYLLKAMGNARAAAALEAASATYKAWGAAQNTLKKASEVFLPPVPQIMAGVTLAAGLANAAQIMSAAKFAKGGDFMTSGPQLIMVGDNPGGRERVQITPTSSPNLEGPRTAGVTINLQAGIVEQGTVADLADRLAHRLRRNLA